MVEGDKMVLGSRREVCLEFWIFNLREARWLEGGLLKRVHSNYVCDFSEKRNIRYFQSKISSRGENCGKI